MYPEPLVAPMRTDLTSAGFTELRTSKDVENHLEDHKGTSLIVINSVCGCAAGAARPGVKMALANSTKKPSFLGTVFPILLHLRQLPCLKTVNWFTL
jgi:putative YphP/YqiW family bacilliredoxin